MSDWISAALGYTVYGSALRAAPSSFINTAFSHSLDAGRKRHHGLITPPPSPALKKFKQDFTAPRANMARTRTFRRGRRFGRRKPRGRRNRVKRTLFRARRRRFRNAVKKVVLRTITEHKKFQFSEVSTNLLPGDGTTSRIRVYAPWQVMFAQGTNSMQMIGSRVRLGKIFWRMHVQSLIDGDVHFQVILYKTDFQMDVTAANTLTNNEGVTVQGNTTTTANPTQTAPNGNIPFFDTLASPGQFAGLSPVTKFNPDVGTIVKKWDYKLLGHGTTGTDPFHDIMITHNFGKDVQIQETDGTIDGVPRFFGPTKRGGYAQYYFLVRCWSQTFVANTNTVLLLHRAVVTFTDT